MKRIFAGLLLGVLIFTGCVPATLESAPPPASATATIPPPTLTPRPTQIPPTQTVTPLPTIPTFIPTFDVSTIVKVTPAPKVECPEVIPNLTPDLNTFFSKNVLRVLMDQPVLDFLNNGGDPQRLITALRQNYNWFDSNTSIQQDITRDGAAELILTDRYVVHVFGCKNKKYQTLLSYTDEPAWVQEIQFKLMEDINLNGIPELIAIEYGGHTYTSIKVSIFEWNGQEFLPLIQGERYDNHQFSTSADTSVPAHVAIYDTDGNGTLELVLESDLPTPVSSLYSYLIPWRNESDIYAWNGTHYILNRIKYASPEFRFQAVQDADYEVARGNLDKALSIYQDVINSDNLKAFSHEILENQIRQSFAIDGHEPIPTPVSPDATEHPRLAAYAYYRIMLLDLVQGQELDAKTTYNTLQQKFVNDPNGKPYAEMATMFWNAYQSTHKVYDGCAAAIQYAAQHPEILVPLGSDYHGTQSHIYIPADVCPFR